MRRDIAGIVRLDAAGRKPAVQHGETDQQGSPPGTRMGRGRPNPKGEAPMSVAVGLNKALDKAYENASLSELLDAPVSAIAGVSDADAQKLAAAFNIKTVRDLGTSKYFKLAEALVALGTQAG
jgi:hypothetical protein